MQRFRFIPLFFFTSLLLWTIALLVPVPNQSASEVLGGDFYRFLFAKFVHGTAYAFLTILGGMMQTSVRQRWCLLGLLSGHAFLTEFLQMFVDRQASWRDVGIDHIGILVGIFASCKRWRVLCQGQ